LNFSLQRYKILSRNPRKRVLIFRFKALFGILLPPATHLPPPCIAYKQGVCGPLVAEWQQIFKTSNVALAFKYYAVIVSKYAKSV
jgi:hypothetical protein